MVAIRTAGRERVWKGEGMRGACVVRVLVTEGWI